MNCLTGHVLKWDGVLKKRVFVLPALSWLLFCVFFAGCEEKEGDKLFLLVTPQELIIPAETGSMVVFQVTAQSEATLTSLVITQYHDHAEPLTLIDTLLSSKTLAYVYSYQVPELSDSSNIIIDFTIADNEPGSLSLRRRIRVHNASELLSETTGHVMYSSLSGKPNAFNIDLLEPVFEEDYPNSMLHILDLSVDSIHHNTLSKRWGSPAGYRFVKFQHFNYAAATGTSLQNAYDAGMKLSIVDNISDEDIILLGFDDAARAAIYVSMVIDADSTVSDRYIFNIKTVQD